MTDVPSIFQDVPEYRSLKVPAFEVELTTNKGDRLDPAPRDRVRVVVEVALSGAAHVAQPIKLIAVTDSGMEPRYSLGEKRCWYDGEVVPGSAIITGYQEAPEQMRLVEA